MANPSASTSPSASSSYSLLSQFPTCCQLSQQTILDLQSFCWVHAVQQHRPMVLVTSGGTAADLEVRTVRSLENFSTGLRGAISVEEFLAHGYAVVFFQRTGSASPYARVVSQVLNEYHATTTSSTSSGSSCGVQQVNHGLTTSALEALFQDEETKRKKKDMTNGIIGASASASASGVTTSTTTSTTNEDPWSMDKDTSPHAFTTNHDTFNDDGTTLDHHHPSSSSSSSSSSVLQLQDRLCHDERLQRSWRDYKRTVVSEQRLLTIPFRTVEEYLVRLEQISVVLQQSAQSLCLFYLAAAVSDYYIPNKAEHKIQSTVEKTNKNNDNHHHVVADSNQKTNSNSSQQQQQQQQQHALTITFQSVPKVMGWLRHQWAPDAFVVSFKLETDMAILRRKAEGAVMNYNIHMVIGNILETRHEKVYVLYNNDYNNDKQQDDTVDGRKNTKNETTNTMDDDDDDKKQKKKTQNRRTSVSVQDWCMKEISKSSSYSSQNNSSSNNNNNTGGPPLEEDLIEFVVQQHLYYISQHYHSSTSSSSSSFVTMVHERLLQERKAYQRTLFWQSITDRILQWGGTLIGMGITYMVSMAIQDRIHSSSSSSSSQYYRGR